MRVHNQISRGDLTAAATRALGVTKNEGGVERYSETVEIVMNPWGMPEWASLRGEYQGATREVVAGVAAELGMIAIVSPASSGLLVVVEYAQFRGTTGAQLELVAEANIVASLLTPGTPLPRDTRGGQRGFLKPLRARVWVGTNVGAWGVPIDEQSTGIAFINLPVVLSPGWGLVITASAVNTLTQGIFGWRERTAYPGELGV